MSDDNDSGVLSSIQQTLLRMEERLTTVCADVENLKRTQTPVGQGAQLSGGRQPGSLQSNAAHSVVTTPESVIGGEDHDDDNVVTRLSWEEQMELTDAKQDADKVSKSAKRPKGEKLRLTKVEEGTEQFLREAFTSMENDDRKELRSKFIIPDTPFTTPPHLDKVMAAESSKSVKSADQSQSRIQALFLDAVGPLTGILDSINKEEEIVIEDVEAAVKAALTFLGNASSQCNTDRRSAVLEEYNKDLMSFGQDSDLFSSATNTLFGPSFPEKAVEHLTQLKTLRQARGTGSKMNQGFSKAPSHYSQRGGRSKAVIRRQNSQPYSKGGSSSRGKAPASFSQRAKPNK